MSTLGDKIVSFWDNYIAPTNTKPTPSNKKSRRLQPKSSYDHELSRDGFDKLNPKKRRELAEHSPLLMKGVRKKSLDTFRAWHSLDTIDGRGNPIKGDMRLIYDFVERSNLKLKFYEARVNSHIYGDGFLLITFTKDEDTRLSDPVRPDSEPWDVEVINSEYINKLDFPNEAARKAGTLYYVYTKNNDPEYIHPDRIIHIPVNQIPGMKLGVSTIDLLRYTIYSKKNVDIAAGYILSWFSRGMVDITVTGAEDDELDDWEETAKKHPSYWAHNEETEINYIEPKAIDPKPFYDFIVLNIASALNMPTHILTGIQIGRVEGSEIGFADYYRDVRDEQELVFTPMIKDLYNRILAANNKVWKYKIEWNPIYIDEGAEAKLLETKINAAEKAYNGSKSGRGFIDQEEARQIVNKGQIELDIQKKIRVQPIPKDSPNGESTPSSETDEDNEMCTGPPENPHKHPVRPLTAENKEMIRRWKEARKKELDDLEDSLFNDEDSS